MSIPFNFKKKYTEEKRKKESDRIIKQYPDRLPIICELDDKFNEKLDKSKYLVPKNLTIRQFNFIIRKRMKLSESEATFLFTENSILIAGHETINDLEIYKNNDGFLYIKVFKENTFG